MSDMDKSIGSVDNIVDKRLFYLMLSIGQGQEFANFMGFSNPSKDVEQAEIFDIASRWALFVNQNILSNIEESAIWMLDLLEKGGRLVNPKEELLPLFISFGVSTLNKMLENEHVSIIINEDALKTWKNTDDERESENNE